MYLGAACLGLASKIRHLPPWREAEAVAPRRRSPSRQPGLRGLGTVTQARSAWLRCARKGQQGEGSWPGCPGLGDLQQEQETRREPWLGGLAARRCSWRCRGAPCRGGTSPKGKVENSRTRSLCYLRVVGEKQSRTANFCCDAGFFWRLWEMLHVLGCCPAPGRCGRAAGGCLQQELAARGAGARSLRSD